MSRIGDLISGLFGNEENGKNTEEKPCRNCPQSCPFYPGVCAECRPFKEQLLDHIYYAEHEEEYLARYEIVPEDAGAVGTEPCPFCGGQNPVTAAVCEYCGSQIREVSGKIRVTAAKDIPSPLLEAQDVIFARRALLARYLSDKKENVGLFDALRDLLDGDENEYVSDLGDKMTEDEIRSAAASYGVSAGTYLQGLDNGIYLTVSAKREQDRKAEEAKVSAHDVRPQGISHGSHVSYVSPISPVRPGKPVHSAHPVHSAPPMQHGQHPGQPARPAHSGQPHSGQPRMAAPHQSMQRPGQHPGHPQSGRAGRRRK